MVRYPDIERKFRRLINVKIETIEKLCKNLVDQESLDVDNMDISLLAENIALSLLYWFPYQSLLHPKMSSSELIHKGVYHILSLVAPYTGDKQHEFMMIIHELYKNNMLKPR
jgi:hypothetical protein